MADPTLPAVTVPDTTTDKTHPLDAGHTTSEFTIAKITVGISGAIALTSTLTEVLGKAQAFFPEAPKGIGLYVAIAAAVLAAISSALYGAQRAALKIAALESGSSVNGYQPPVVVPAPVEAPKGYARLGVMLALALTGCAGVSALAGSTGPIPVTVEKDAAGNTVATSTVTVTTTPAVLLPSGACMKPLAISFDSLTGQHDACNVSIPLKPVNGICP